MNVRVAVPAFVAAVIASAGMAAAQAPVRPTDKQVKQLILAARGAFDRFVDKMSLPMRTAVIKGATYELDVSALLRDLEEMSKDAEERFRPPAYSSSTEVTAYLVRLKRLDAGLLGRPGLSGADRYWDDARPVYSRLASAYGIEWNSDPASWSGRRISDGEVKSAAADIKRLADTLADGVDRALRADKGVDQKSRAGAVDRARGLGVLAGDFTKEVQSGRDAAPALGRLSDGIDAFTAATPGGGLAGPAGATFETVKSRLAVLKGAFGK